MCKGCHKKIWEKWSASVHGNFAKDAVADPKVIGGDFTGNWDKVVNFKATDVQYVLLSKPGILGTQELVGKKGTFGVDADDYPVLWASWEFEKGEWVIEPAGLGKGEPWLMRCAGCHVAGLKVPTKANPGVKKGFALLGITCEQCHGPAKKHAESMGAEAVVKDLNAQNCGQCHNTSSTSIAAKPDGSKFSYPYNDTDGAYVPGKPLADFLTIPDKSNTKVFWPTGHIKGTHHPQYPEYVNTGHAKALPALKSNKGAQDRCLECHSADYYLAKENGEKDLPTLKTAKESVSCQVCHDSHDPTALRKPKTQVCTQCHNGEGKFTIGKEAHHPQKEMNEGKLNLPGFPVQPSVMQAAGITCVDCHMTATAVSGEVKRHSHLMKVVMPKDGKAYGMPDSCSSCHLGTGQSAKANLDNLQKYINTWQGTVNKKLANVKGLLNANKAKFANRTEYKQALTYASIVEADGSKGVHNYALAVKLLDTAAAKLNALKK